MEAIIAMLILLTKQAFYCLSMMLKIICNTTIFRLQETHLCDYFTHL